MKVEKRYQVARAAAKELERPMLNFVKLDVENKTLTAADGFILAQVPCTVEEGDVSVAIPADAITQAQQFGRNDESCPIIVQEDFARVEAKTPRHDFEVVWPTLDHFPDSDAILKPAIEQEPTIGINVQLLYNLAKALGSFEVTLHIGWQYSAIGVTTNIGSAGAIMPRHSSKIKGTNWKQGDRRVVLMTPAEYRAWEALRDNKDVEEQKPPPIKAYNVFTIDHIRRYVAEHEHEPNCISVAWNQMLEDIDKFGEEYTIKEFLDEASEQAGEHLERY